VLSNNKGLVPCLLSRGILRDVILLVPSLSATTSSSPPPETACVSDLTLMVDYACVTCASIVL